MKLARFLPLLLSGLLVPLAAQADHGVNLTHDLPHVDVLHDGQPARIERNPDTENMLDPDFSLTSRPCPPYCIQPMQLAPGVETLGELELIGYLQRVGRDTGVLVIDSRDGDWPLRSGLIPGAISLPWQELHPAHASAPRKSPTCSCLRFGAARQDGLWNFESAKTLVLYCNGPWCGQAPTNIKQLLALGYPPHKLKWYRGGMQDWKMLGLTTVAPTTKQGD
jgi:rhodanese-related sulfurtransferase